MAVTTTESLTIPALFGASGTLTTSATASSGLAVGLLVDLNDGSNEVIGLLTAVASTSIAFIVIEIRQGAAGNTLASGAKVQLGYISSGAVLSAKDIDWTTYGANKVLSAIVSNGLPFSFSSSPPVSGASLTAGSVPLSALAKVVEATYLHDGTAAPVTVHSVVDSVTAAGVSTTVNLTGAAAFASADFFVLIQDNAALGTLIVPSAQTASSFTFASTNAHVYSYIAIGA